MATTTKAGATSETFFQHLRDGLNHVKYRTRFDGESGAERAYNQELSHLSIDSGAPLSIYIHVPFCPVRCLNCESNTTINHDSDAIERYLCSLEKELQLVADRVGSNRALVQLHVGGGTPNYLSDSQIVRLMASVERRFSFQPDAEVSIDANPKYASRSQLELLRGLGFTRVDFGVRDLDPAVQNAIGRIHSSDLVGEVFDSSRDAGFTSVNIDLVYGLPAQSLRSMEKTLETLTALAPDRVSCFSFNKRTELFPHQIAIDSFASPSLADKMILFNSIVEGLTAADYTWVGLDCFARREDPLCKAQSERRLRRNSIGYTLHDSNDCLGFGTSAVSELNGVCVQNHFQVPRWHESLGAGAFPVRGGFRISGDGLRYREAVSNLMCNMESSDSEVLLDKEKSELDLTRYMGDGIVDFSTDKISITEAGRFMLHHLWNDALPVHRWETAL